MPVLRGLSTSQSLVTGSGLRLLAHHRKLGQLRRLLRELETVKTLQDTEHRARLLLQVQACTSLWHAACHMGGLAGGPVHSGHPALLGVQEGRGHIPALRLHRVFYSNPTSTASTAT